MAPAAATSKTCIVSDCSFAGDSPVAIPKHLQIAGCLGKVSRPRLPGEPVRLFTILGGGVWSADGRVQLGQLTACVDQVGSDPRARPQSSLIEEQTSFPVTGQ